ncbi:hypothetical protein SAMN05428937_3727 [Achromobacter sp. MFA1 R4]|nr:hypothetical protein SAMN05428937_0020 [Achromobacter sp. MFA1 R4]SIT27888.1 hypothetical protein SAMN05428937_3727 [Achromobacter sp. MFA1 R4]
MSWPEAFFGAVFIICVAWVYVTAIKDKDD